MKKLIVLCFALWASNAYADLDSLRRAEMQQQRQEQAAAQKARAEAAAREKARAEAAQKARAEAAARERIRQEELARERAKKEAKEERDYQERMADKYRRQAQEDKLFELELEARRDDLAAQKGNRAHEDRMRNLDYDREKARTEEYSKNADKYGKLDLRAEKKRQDTQAYRERLDAKGQYEIAKGERKRLENSYERINLDTAEHTHLINPHTGAYLEAEKHTSVAKIISLTLIVLALIAGGLFYLLFHQKKQQQNPPTNP